MTPLLILALAAAETTDLEQAKRHFHDAVRLYQEARYEEAIAELEAAHRLKPSGVIFFNIAKCHEALGDEANALRSYREYLKQEPHAPDLDAVSARVAELTRRQAETAAVRGDKPLALPSPPPAPHDAGPPKRATTGTFVAAGGAGAALVLGLVLGVTAQGARADLLREPHPRAAVQQLSDTITGTATGANIAYGAATAAALTAVILYFVEPPKPEPAKAGAPR